jgi:NAD(P)-dependent dehydrogenase (short-subunit alcohol dehydrogenase family)
MSRTVLISGASKGIGRALAERMAEQGHKVVGIARTSDATPHPCGSRTGTRAGAHAGYDDRHGEAAARLNGRESIADENVPVPGPPLVD